MMAITERIGPKGSPRRTRALIWVAIILMLGGFLWLALGQAASDAAKSARDAAQDRVIAQQVQDANAYRKALASKGVNPNSVAPPPQTRTAPLASLPAATGPTDSQVQAAVDRYMALHQPADGRDGTNGTSPPCLSQPGQCQGIAGSPGANGQDGSSPPCLTDGTECRGSQGEPGKTGPQGRSIATIMLRSVGDGRCVISGTYDDQTTWTASGGTVPCETAEPSSSPSVEPSVEPSVAPLKRHPAVTPSRPAAKASTRVSASASPHVSRRALPVLPPDWGILGFVIPVGMCRKWKGTLS